MIDTYESGKCHHSQFYVKLKEDYNNIEIPILPKKRHETSSIRNMSFFNTHAARYRVLSFLYFYMAEL